MKKIVFALLIMFSIPALAQRIDKPGEPYEYYCRIFYISTNIQITLPTEDGKKEVYLRDENGKKISFLTDIDAINYFTKRGWIYVEKDGSYRIIKKIVTDDKQLFENINIDKKKGED